ncbi:MAG: VacJ family lipoprotein [Desulfobacterales bacterium]|nr:VacJ family lipoprotein [Desulfobacterales bacterium]
MTSQLAFKSIRKVIPVLGLVLLMLTIYALPLAAQKAPDQRKLTDPSAAGFEPAMDVYDPWEGWNRGVYKFNYGFDKFVFLPLVRGYQFIVPETGRKGVTNFFSNLSEVQNFANNLMQGKIEGCVNSVFRFAFNSTLGLGGLMDPATDMGFPEWKEDFGQTMGVWGVGPGPYMVLPVLGPSSLRDAGGLAVDAVVNSLWRDFLINEGTDWSTSTEDKVKWSLTGLQILNTRSNVAFRYYGTGSPFEYELIKFLYLKNRQILVEQ